MAERVDVSSIEFATKRVPGSYLAVMRSPIELQDAIIAFSLQAHVAGLGLVSSGLFGIPNTIY
jgi:hypothetical protein